jgi:hypothetical protein
VSTLGRGLLAATCLLGCGGEPAEPPARRGIGDVRVATIADGVGRGADLTTIDAHFLRPGTRGECEVSDHGSCVVYDCTEDPSERPTAGELSIDTGDARFTQKLLPDGDGQYSFGDEAGVFEPGDSITASFAGDEVPAVELVGVFPAPVVITEPAPPSDGSAIAVPRGADLTLRWSDGVTGTTVSLSQDTQSSKVLRCSVKAESGELTVPTSALAELDAGRLDVRTVRSVTASAGNYDTALVLLAAGVDAAGDGVGLALED